MAYLTLYREWRPQTFQEIVGQEHISRTLRNAIESNRIAHAYIFCGPRGTGKTSTAKIYSKALNCLAPVSSEPCNECDNCQAITASISADVNEIDAASNRGIDEIRELREKVKFAPSNCRYKVYIIDEVHMLTNEAFNALLKTLEEPPSHVIFILATTEPHKVPLTILSRCQRFDFKRIEQSIIIEKLKKIASAIQLEIEPTALSLIARAAEGSLRDALCILEQGITFINAKSTFSYDEEDRYSLDSSNSEGERDSYPDVLKEEDIHGILGTVREDLLREMAEYLRKSEAGAILELIGRLEESGKDVRLFIKDLTAFLRNLLLEEVFQVNEGSPGKFQSSKSQRLLEIIEIMVWAEKEMRWSSQPRLLLELAAAKACLLEPGKPGRVEDGLEWRVNEIEQKLEEVNTLLENILLEGKVGNDSRNGDINKIEVEKVVEAGIVETGNDSIISLEQIKAKWRDVLSGLKVKSLPAYTLVSKSEPMEIADKLLTIGFSRKNNFDKERLENSSSQKILENVIKDVFGWNLEVRCKIYEKVGSNYKNLSATKKYKEEVIPEQSGIEAINSSNREYGSGQDSEMATTSKQEMEGSKCEVGEVLKLFGAEETSLDGFKDFIALQFSVPDKKLDNKE